MGLISRVSSRTYRERLTHYKATMVTTGKKGDDAPQTELDLSTIDRRGFHLRKDLTDAQKDELRAIIKAEKDEAAKAPGRRGRIPVLTDEEREARAEARRYVPTGKPRGRPKKGSKGGFKPRLTDEEREARKYVPTGKPRGRPKKSD